MMDYSSPNTMMPDAPQARIDATQTDAPVVLTQVERNRRFFSHLQKITGMSTPKKLAIYFDVHPTHMCNYYAGRKIGAALLCQISDRLDVSVRKLKEWL